MTKENQICTDCEGVICANMNGSSRILGSLKNRVAYKMEEPIANCPVKNGESGIRRKLTDDAIWDVTSEELKGWKKHRAFAKRVWDERND